MAAPHTSEFRSRERVTVISESGVRTGPSFILLHGVGMGRRYRDNLTGQDVMLTNGRTVATLIARHAEGRQ